MEIKKMYLKCKKFLWQKNIIKSVLRCSHISFKQYTYTIIRWLFTFSDYLHAR